MSIAPAKRLDGLRFAFRAAWAASSRTTIGLVVLQVLGAVAIAVQLGALARVLPVVAEDGGGGWTAELVSSLFVFGVALGVSGVVTAATRELRTLVVERVAHRTNLSLLAVVERARLEEIESADFHDRLGRARASYRVRLFQLVWGALNLVAMSLQLVAIGAVLIALAPAVLLVAVLAAFPLLVASRVNTRALYRHAFDLTAQDRRRSWLEQLLFDRAAAAELHASEVRPFLAERVTTLTDTRERLTERLVRRRLNVSIISAFASAALSTLAVAGLLGLVFTGNIDFADAAVAVVALQQVRGRTTGVATGLNDLAEASAFARDVTDFLNSPREVGPANHRIRPTSEVELRNLGFRYPGNERLAVDDVSLSIGRGETLAIVGENGSGKTTLAKLIAGLYRPTAGSIAIDSRPLGNGEVTECAVVFQDFNRYALTASENISLADTASTDQARAEAAARAAGAHDFLASLPQGYDTVLAREFEGGTELSGGQWQRVAIARALYSDAELLILDEPSSALDARSESELYIALAADAAERFTVVISHRFSTVRSANRILVMHEGKAVEIGSHEELMAFDGRYADLFRLQASPYYDL